ncbi:hypothetical protein K1719_041012 [Acacia pycnantha]|nr:hypothetical protein K1719_041012 [Acacia pycnantha]
MRTGLPHNQMRNPWLTQVTDVLARVNLTSHKQTLEHKVLKAQGQTSNPSQGLYGAGAHTDYGLINLLATDDVPGLHICNDRDAKPQIWEDVAPLKGIIVCCGYYCPNIYIESWGHAGALEQLHFQVHIAQSSRKWPRKILCKPSLCSLKFQLSISCRSDF